MSVVIPCHNYARYLRGAIGSVLARQDGIDVDVIVVDDASTDDSLAVARTAAADDPRVRVLTNAANRGAVATFNRGLAEARGEFVVRLDADDMLTPGSLTRAVALMQAEPAVGLVYGHPLHFSGAMLPAPRGSATSWTIWKGRDWLAARCAAGDNVITSPEVLMRRSVVDAVGGQRPLAHTHDMEMWLRIAACSDVAHVDGADQAWHREHAGSLSTRAESPLVIMSEIRDAFDVLFEGVGADVAGSAGMHAEARRAVARQALAHARRDIDRGDISASALKLVDFAIACDPGISASRAGRSLSAAMLRARRLPHGLASLLGMLPRLGRRVSDRRLKARWYRTGVYERMHTARIKSR